MSTCIGHGEGVSRVQKQNIGERRINGLRPQRRQEEIRLRVSWLSLLETLKQFKVHKARNAMQPYKRISFFSIDMGHSPIYTVNAKTR